MGSGLRVGIAGHRGMLILDRLIATIVLISE